MRLVGLGKRFDQRDRIGVFGQIPERAVAARVEQHIEVLGLDVGQTVRACQGLLRLGILLEALGGVGLCVGLVALGIQRRLATLGRNQGDVRACILEHVIRRGEFFQPNPVFLPVSPSWSWDVSTIKTFIASPHVMAQLGKAASVQFSPLQPRVERVVPAACS